MYIGLILFFSKKRFVFMNYLFIHLKALGWAEVINLLDGEI